ncbi:MAG: hypothetical protein IJO25_04560 [Clostridia bacterium]|nr:hypothetical protein [Clostridia bacterium]
MTSTNLVLLALLFLFYSSGNISSTQLFLLLALFTTTSCVCSNQTNA